MPYLCQRPLDVLNVLRVHSSDTVDTPRNLVDVDADFLQLCGLRPDVAGVHVDDIPVNQHFPGIGRKILCAELGHFLLEQGPFFRRHRDALHDLMLSVSIIHICPMECCYMQVN